MVSGATLEFSRVRQAEWGPGWAAYGTDVWRGVIPGVGKIRSPCMRNRHPTLLPAGLLCLALGGCFFADVADPRSEPDSRGRDPTFAIGGSVQGSRGVLTLQNSNGTQLNVAADGAFSFDTPMVSSARYNVTVAVLPRDQNCRVSNGSGTVGKADIRDVVVTCK